jgi:uncharacterized protein YjbJ (UPF0337 family)
MPNDRDFKTHAMFRDAAARVGRELGRQPVRVRDTAATALRAAKADDGPAKPDDRLTSERRSPTVRSAREDRIRGRIDKIAGRVLEAIGRLTGKRSTVVKGKAARGRGMGRMAKGRLKRLAR